MLAVSAFSALSVHLVQRECEKEVVIHDKRRETFDRIAEEQLVDLSNYRYMSLSVDDTISLFQDLYEKHELYESAFENANLLKLRRLHELYGATFVLYCYLESDDRTFDFGMLDQRYAGDFQLSSSWLKSAAAVPRE